MNGTRLCRSIETNEGKEEGARGVKLVRPLVSTINQDLRLWLSKIRVGERSAIIQGYEGVERKLAAFAHSLAGLATAEEGKHFCLVQRARDQQTWEMACISNDVELAA